MANRLRRVVARVVSVMTTRTVRAYNEHGTLVDMPDRTFEIADIDGSNKRTTTLSAFRADLDARKVNTAAIMASMRRGDRAGVAKAQAEMRARFPK